MALPSIQFDRSMVQDKSRPIAVVGAAQRQALGAIDAGLQALGQEMVKTQNQKAAADFEEGLAKVEADLSAKKYFTTQEVKDQLGQSLDSLPPEVRGQLTKKTVNPVTGEEVEVDKTDIPAWVVAGAIYDKRARDVARSSSEAISVPGWQAEFQEQAQHAVATRKARINEQQLHAMVADQKEQQRAVVDKFTRLGLWDDAIRTIDQSNSWMPGEKSALAENVLAAKARATAAQQRIAEASQVEAKSAEIMTKVTLPGYGWVDPAKAQAAIDAIPADDPTKDDVRKLVEHQVMKSEQLRERAGKDMLNRAQAMLAQGVPLTGAQMAPVKAWLLDPANGGAGEWRTLQRMVETDERTARIERNTRLAEDRRATKEERDAAAKAAEEAKAAQKVANDDARGAFIRMDLKDRAKLSPDRAFPDADKATRTALVEEARRAAAAVQKGQDVPYSAFGQQVSAAVAGLEKEDADKVRVSLERWYWGEKDKAPEVEPGQVAVSKALADALTIMNVPWGYDKPRGALDDARGMQPVPAEEQVYEPARRALGAPGASPAPGPAATSTQPTSGDAARIQAAWKARFPGRPPLTADQVARALAAEGGR